MKRNVVRPHLTLLALGLFFTASIASAATATLVAQVYGTSGPWDSTLNPSFAWGTSVSSPTVIVSSAGLTITPGDNLSISYESGCVSGGWPGCYDANGWSGFGDLAGVGGPAYFINPSQGPVYFMALLGAFTDSKGAIVGNPFKIGDGPLTMLIPDRATALSMGFNDGGGGFFDNGGVIAVSITETTAAIPEPEINTMLLVGFGLMGAIAHRRTLKQKHYC